MRYTYIESIFSSEIYVHGVNLPYHKQENLNWHRVNSLNWDRVNLPSIGDHRRRKSHLKQLRLPQFPTSFHRSPRKYQTRFPGSPQDFKHVFTWVNGVPAAQKSGQENRWIWIFKKSKSDRLREWYTRIESMYIERRLTLCTYISLDCIYSACSLAPTLFGITAYNGGRLA